MGLAIAGRRRGGVWSRIDERRAGRLGTTGIWVVLGVGRRRGCVAGGRVTIVAGKRERGENVSSAGFCW